MRRKRKLPEGMTRRGRHYYCDFYAGGRRVRKRLATDLNAPKDILVETRSRAQKGDYGLLDNDFPLAEPKQQWLRYCRQALEPKSIARYEACLGNILPRLAVGRAAGILVASVLAYREERLAEGTPLAELQPLPNDRPK
jgi:hypothetical protein